MKIIEAGWGEPPKGCDFYLNQSRLLTYQDCPQKHHWKYTENIEPDWPNHPALIIGSLYHETEERIFDLGVWGNPDALDHLMEREIEPAIEGHINEYGSAGKDTKELDKLGDWLRATFLQKFRRYPDGPPTGSTEAVEKAFYLVCEVVGRTYCILGTFDKLSQKEDLYWNGEVKTHGPNTDPAAFLAWRKKHPQHIIYDLAGFTIYRDKWGGTIYDLTAKHPYPQKASKNGSLEERIEQWKASLFTFQRVRSTQHARAEGLDLLADWLIHYGERSEARAVNQCLRFGKVDCPYFSKCYEPLEGIINHFRPRDPDYVDQAERTPNED